MAPTNTRESIKAKNSINDVMDALMMTDPNGLPFIPAIDKIIETGCYSAADMLGVDLRAIFGSEYRSGLTACHGSIPIQVKSSDDGICKFIEEQDNLRIRYLNREGGNPRQLTRVLVLNGQAGSWQIIHDFGYNLPLFAGLTQNPNDDRVLELLNQCLHPDIVRNTLALMAQTPAEVHGNVYDQRLTRFPHGTVVQVAPFVQGQRTRTSAPYVYRRQGRR